MFFIFVDNYYTDTNIRIKYMKRLFLVLTLLIPLFVFSQNDYYPIQCEGDIPREFLEKTSVKIASDNHKSSSNSSISNRQFRRFNAINNYYVDYLLKGGKIVFGTDMNEYVNKVGFNVIDNFDGIEREEIRFYIVKSPYVNAFTTENGLIFINIGLIAQLENEAQLAYVISHELVHYKYHHSLNTYKEKNRSTYDRGTISRNSSEARMVEYSHDQEFMADSLGFLEAYSKMGYDFDQVINLFDVLLYSNLPFDEIEFKKDFFNDSNYIVDEKYIMKEVDLISNPEDYDDSHSSHPNVKKRRSNMIDLVTDFDSDNRNLYLISKKDFQKLQKEARFEMSNLFISNLEYGKAFYNSYLLLRDFPDNKYLKKTLTYSIYALAKIRMEGGLSDVLTSYKKLEGQSQRVNFFFKKIKAKNLSLLSVKWLWKYNMEYPNDAYMNDLLDDVTYALIDRYDINYSAFYVPEHSISVNSSDSSSSKPIFKKLSPEEYEELNKYDKIRYDKKFEKYYGNAHRSRSTIVKTENYKRILSTETLDENFKEYYKGVYKKVSNDNDISEGETTSEKLKIDKLVVVNPTYYFVKDGEFRINNFEEKEEIISKSFTTLSWKEGINTTLIDIMKIRESQVDKFNDLAFMNSWMYEFENVTDDDGNSKLIPWQTNYIQGIREKYNMRYISSMGVIDESYANQFSIYQLYTVFFLTALPSTIVNFALNKKMIHHFFYCVDLNTNKIIYFNIESMEGKSSQDFVNSLNYNVVNELKKL